MAAKKAKFAAKRTVRTGRFICGISAVFAIPAFLFAQAPVSPSTTQSLQQLVQQAHSPTIPALPSSLSITPEGISKLKLMPGSMINVHVFEETDLDGAYRIDDSGDISIPMAGAIRVAYLSLREAETAVRAKLISAGVLNDPHVVVNIADYGAQYVTVMGEVSSPGRFAVLAPRELRDLIALAGGTTPVAGNEITIHRADQPDQKTEIIHYNRNRDGDAQLNTVINPGDSVVVKRAGIVYVLGAVYRPGGFIMQESGSLNVAEALSLASGTSLEAAISNVKVLRKNSDGTWLYIDVPLNKIQKGKAVPMALQDEDIVYVPPSLLKETGINAKAIAGGVGQALVYRVP
jgi:polysaccharide export outer membrane protein